MKQIKIIDKNKDLIQKLKEIGFEALEGDIIQFHKDNQKTVLCSASNPIFSMGGGLDAEIKNHFPEIVKQIKGGLGNQRIENICFLISVDNNIKADKKLIAEALDFAFKNTKYDETLLLTGLGTGIGGLNIDDFIKLFKKSYITGFKWFKCLNNGKAKDGGSFDYSDYIKNKKSLPLIKDIKICNKGYHLTNNINDWLSNATDVFEVVPKDIVQIENYKIVCSSFKFLERFETNSGNRNSGNSNSGNRNSGDRNSGDRNSGNRNSGDRNSGDRNSGNRNSGDRNSGDSNSGDRNSGDRNSGDSNSGNRNSGDSNSGNRNSGNRNSGDRNSGDRNSGNRNSGDRNSGDRNSGNRNSGDRNSGDSNSGDRNSGNRNSGDSNSGNRNSGDSNSGNWNSGDRNSGNWNSGDSNSGYFNTNRPQIRIFNKETKQIDINFPNWLFFNLNVWVEELSMTEEEKKIYFWFKTTQGFLRKVDYKEAFKITFEKASVEELKQTLELPNFSYEIFEEISGISKADFERRLKEVK